MTLDHCATVFNSLPIKLRVTMGIAASANGGGALVAQLPARNEARCVVATANQRGGGLAAVETEGGWSMWTAVSLAGIDIREDLASRANATVGTRGGDLTLLSDASEAAPRVPAASIAAGYPVRVGSRDHLVKAESDADSASSDARGFTPAAGPDAELERARQVAVDAIRDRGATIGAGGFGVVASNVDRAWTLVTARDDADVWHVWMKEGRVAVVRRGAVRWNWRPSGAPCDLFAAADARDDNNC